MQQVVTTETDARTSLALSAGRVFMQNKRCKKAHICSEYGVAICGNIIRPKADNLGDRVEAGKACKRCIKAAQKKGLGVRYE